MQSTSQQMVIDYIVDTFSVESIENKSKKMLTPSEFAEALWSIGYTNQLHVSRIFRNLTRDRRGNIDVHNMVNTYYSWQKISAFGQSWWKSPRTNVMEGDGGQTNSAVQFTQVVPEPIVSENDLFFEI